MAPPDRQQSGKHDSQAENLEETLATGQLGDTVPKEASAILGPLPMTFGRYRILKSTGDGAMGAVYLAHDTQLDRNVALKIPKFPEDGSGRLVERFYREARAAATLSHPNICPVFDVGQIEDLHYITMEFIQGRPLSEYIRDDRRLSADATARVVRKVALAMQEAHVHAVVHRDLKPANIMINQRNEPIVMDFGLARRSDQDDQSRLTRDGAIMGSPAYMSPEQLEGQQDKIGPSCDIYSLGVVMYELLTGKLPFQGTGSIASVIREIFTKEPQSPLELHADINSTLSHICLKALEKQPQDRYDTMHDLAVALTSFLKAPTDGTASGQQMDADAVARSSQAERYEESPSLLEMDFSQEPNQSAVVSRTLPRSRRHYPFPRWLILVLPIGLLVIIAAVVLVTLLNQHPVTDDAPLAVASTTDGESPEVTTVAPTTSGMERELDKRGKAPARPASPNFPVTPEQPDRQKRSRDFAPKRRISAEKMFVEFDKNQDGRLLPREVPRNFQERFDEIDKNGNGSLNKDEFLYAHRNILPQPGPRAPRGRPDRRPGLGSDARRTQPRENDR